MIVAAVRQVADWLVDASTGVNAQLASVPGDDADAKPPLVTVWDATRFEWVARGNVLRDKTGAGPLLLVRGPDQAELPTWAGDEAGGWASVDVRVAYVRRPTVDQPSDYVLRDAYQTLRAAVRALQAPFQDMSATNERMAVEFARPTIVFDAQQEEMSGKETILASLLVTLPAFDQWSLGGST